MKKAEIKQWTAALRSGEYKQGRRALCQIDSYGNEYFCPLGVYCDLFVDGYWILDTKLAVALPNMARCYTLQYKGQSYRGIPPEDLNNSVFRGNLFSSVMYYNDDCLRSFLCIASYIECQAYATFNYNF